MYYPKISIVTPNYNGGTFLEHTILSLLNQNYPNLEYIVIDGGSTDNSLAIIDKYRDRISYFVSEKDAGLYHAIRKGFEQATGEIMGWLNSDDMHHPQSLFTIGEIFSSFPQVQWLMGNPSYFDEKGRTIYCAGTPRLSKYDLMIKNGDLLQQESTFWTRKLWDAAGNYISTEYKYAGDFELWTRFFNVELLYTTDTLLAGFRFRSKNQLTLDHYDEYKNETVTIQEKNTGFTDHTVLSSYKGFRRVNKLFEKTKLFNHPYFNKLARRKLGMQTPQVIFDRIEQCYKLL